MVGRFVLHASGVRVAVSSALSATWAGWAPSSANVQFPRLHRQDGVADRIGRCIPIEHLADSGIHQCPALVRIPHRLGLKFGRAGRTQFDSRPQVCIQLRHANDCAAVPLPETVGSRHLRDRYTGMETGQSDVFLVHARPSRLEGRSSRPVEPPGTVAASSRRRPSK